MVNTKLGRYHVAEPPSSLLRMHLYDGSPLREVDHEPQVYVLDQEDLIEQGIDTSKIVPGAKKVDALGSCVFNATTAHLSTVLKKHAFEKLTGSPTPYADRKAAEIYAIRLYHQTTDLTGDPSSEWPPTDCGSCGLYVCKQLEVQGVIGSHLTAAGADNVVSLMQANSVICGQPWFNSWFEPDKNGFIDGDGSAHALQKAINSGVAGGHETCWSAVEKLVTDHAGRVDAAKTVIRFRNSWSKTWGDHGSGRVHLSTYVQLAQQCDWRQMVAA
jgi:hypothetical protein